MSTTALVIGGVAVLVALIAAYAYMQSRPGPKSVLEQILSGVGGGAGIGTLLKGVL